jgi:hypothetical protein
MKTHLKKSNYRQILDFAQNRATTSTRIEGTKLQALAKLINKNGEVVSSDDGKFDGIKFLRISRYELVGLSITHYRKSFFPCKIKCHLLQLNPNSKAYTLLTSAL